MWCEVTSDLPVPLLRILWRSVTSLLKVISYPVCAVIVGRIQTSGWMVTIQLGDQQTLHLQRELISDLMAALAGSASTMSPSGT